MYFFMLFTSTFMVDVNNINVDKWVEHLLLYK